MHSSLRFGTIVLALLGPSGAEAQAAPREGQVSVIVQQLFDAMRASDTAATRRLFVAAGRVIPIPAKASGSPGPQPLSVDQFVAFVGRNAPGVWIERIWSPGQRVNGALADVWFEYDVYRGTTFSHCGVNSVQMYEAADGWRIVSMAFTSATTGCAPHPPPE